MNKHESAITAAVRAGIEDDSQYGAVVPPLHLSSTFSFEAFARARQHDYSRSGNPTRDLLAQALCRLEQGSAGVVTSTGMAAITTVLQLLKPGDRLLAASDCYGGTWRLMDAWAARGGFELEWVDFHNPDAWQQSLQRSARMVWLETPSNPLLRITDIKSVADAAHHAGVIVVADNTFQSPLGQQPIKLGADIVVHSTTKYINGHSDVLGGAVITADEEVGDRLAWWANCLGVTGGAFDSWMTLRGLRTLHVRLQRHQQNALAIAGLLQNDSRVSRVFYPGLETHPGHVLAKRQQSGSGGIVSFELDGGRNAAARFVEGLRIISLAESLGGVETLVAHPASMTHAAMSADARKRAGIGEGLLRLSVGLEQIDDLATEILGALSRSKGPKHSTAPGKRHHAI